MVDGPGQDDPRHVGEVAVDRRRIAARVAALAGEIARYYGQAELTILAVLTGSVIFLADLIRQLPLPMRLELVSIGSYPGPSTVSQGPHLTDPIPSDLAGKNVLVVDDILDTGWTLQVLLAAVAAHKPASLRSCVLLRKHQGLAPALEPDFVGFEVGPEFLVGYGLDYDNYYRNLPDIRIFRRAEARAADEGGT